MDARMRDSIRLKYTLKPGDVLQRVTPSWTGIGFVIVVDPIRTEGVLFAYTEYCVKWKSDAYSGRNILGSSWFDEETLFESLLWRRCV